MMAVASGGALRPIGTWNHLRAVLLLPVTNTLVIPAALLAAARDASFGWLASWAPTTVLRAALGLGLLAGGLALTVSAIVLFVRSGHGTLAPWDATQRLVTAGVYRLSRNPMKSGLFAILAAECLLTCSLALAIWAGAFALANVVYIRLVEEPGLHARFGAAYALYCSAVPRWLPAQRVLRQLFPRRAAS